MPVLVGRTAGDASGRCQREMPAQVGSEDPPGGGHDEFGRPQLGDDISWGTCVSPSQRARMSHCLPELGLAQALALSASLVLSPAAADVQTGAGNTMKNGVIYGNESPNSYCVCFA